MSLIPFIIDLADELHELGRCLANGVDIDDFGFGIYAGGEHVQPPQHHQPSTRRTRSTPFYWLPSKRHHPYCRSKATCCSKVNTEDLTSGPVDREAPGTANTINSNNNIPSTPGKSAAYSVVNRNGFQVSMNVKQFAPNELSVKTINNCIIVEGRHDDKEDGHGVISRHFVRKYMLPKGYDPNDVTSTLSSDGILTVRAPPPLAIKNAERQERIVEIQPFSGPAQLTSAKENPKEPAKNILTANFTINQPAEKKQKLDQSQQSLQQTADNVEENKVAEALRENVAKALQLQNQQQQQQNEPVDVIEKIMQSQQQEEENSGQINEGSTQTDVVVVSLNIEKLQENGDTKSDETLISEPEAEAETMLESSNAAFIIPAKTTETTEAKNIGATTTMRTVHNVQNDTFALTNSNEEHNSANSTVTLSEHQDANANITAVVANINSFVSASQPPSLLLRPSDNGIPDALPSIASQSTITGTALDDGDVKMDGAVASTQGNVKNEVALLKAVASNAVVVTTKTNDETTPTIADKECDLFVKTHLDNSNKATLALVNEEIAK